MALLSPINAAALWLTDTDALIEKTTSSGIVLTDPTAGCEVKK